MKLLMHGPDEAIAVWQGLRHASPKGQKAFRERKRQQLSKIWTSRPAAVNIGLCGTDAVAVMFLCSGGFGTAP
jgi:hypothetical protein